MGYNIEVSFNTLKNNSVTELTNLITNTAYGCEYFYIDYEYDDHTKFKRNHCIITVYFNKTNIHELLDFLKFIKKTYGLYLESIYDDTLECILYASQYYITQKMDKIYAKNYKKERRERSYSEDDNMILYSIKK
jgi:hypothetical protein